MNSPTGEAFDNAINPLFANDNFLGETTCGLICNGAVGTEGRPHWR